MSLFVLSFALSSAALYSFRYLFSDFTPILQPSVISSAMVLSDSSTMSFTFVLIQDMPLAIGFGSLPSSWYSSISFCISCFIASCSSLHSISIFFIFAACTYPSTSSIDETPILIPASHSLSSFIVSGDIISYTSLACI